MGRCWWKSSFYWRKIGRTWTNFNGTNFNFKWCCDDDASSSSISFSKSLIAQHPFCKMIFIKLFIFWDRRINVILVLKTFPRCAHGLYHLMEKWGERFGEKWWFSVRKLSVVCHFVSRCARGLYHLIEKWGDWAKIGDFQWRQLSLICHFI